MSEYGPKSHVFMKTKKNCIAYYVKNETLYSMTSKNDFQAETVDVYIHENLGKENFSALSGI